MVLSLFLTFFKIGLFTFGGGYAMIAQIKEVIVQNKKWLTDDELIEMLAIAESTPGPIAINMATYIGYKQKGFIGSVCATLGVILPSVIIIFIISLFLEEFMENKYVAYAFAGIKCAVAFLILKAGYELLTKLKKRAVPITVFCVVLGIILAFEILGIEGISSIIFIVIGGAIGIVASSLTKIREEKK